VVRPALARPIHGANSRRAVFLLGSGLCDARCGAKPACQPNPSTRWPKQLPPVVPTPYAAAMQIESVHHIGIRVTDGERAVAFYEQLGFRVVYRDAQDPVLVLKTESGVEINLIVNAPASFDGKNRLMDVPEKFPGFTHVALRVASIDAALAWAERAGLTITEGPKQLGDGISLFFRDPDANVIELRQDVR
jgi:lactoylglutathione lyase